MNIFIYKILRMIFYVSLGLALTTICMVSAGVSIVLSIMWHKPLLALIAIPAFLVWYILLPLIIRKYYNG
jgi:hypothetical protein